MTIHTHSFTYRITDRDQGRSLRSFLAKEGYSHHILSSMKALPLAVTVNGQSRFLNTPLRAGDLVEARIPSEERRPDGKPPILPADVPFSILYEDEDILVADKPAGVPCHPSPNHYEDTLANGLARLYLDRGLPFVFHCINRIDRDTSGIVLLAKHALAASLLSRSLQKREIRRTYLALAGGTITAPATIDLPIGRKPGSIIERCIDPDLGAPAVTHYRPLALELPKGLSLSGGNTFTCLELHLETGRTHQIRVHMAAIGHPLVGDSLYGRAADSDHPAVPGRQALHSWKMSLLHPIKKEVMQFCAPPPSDLLAFLEQAGAETKAVP